MARVADAVDQVRLIERLVPTAGRRVVGPDREGNLMITHRWAQPDATVLVMYHHPNAYSSQPTEPRLRLIVQIGGSQDTLVTCGPADCASAENFTRSLIAVLKEYGCSIPADAELDLLRNLVPLPQEVTEHLHPAPAA